MQENVMGDYLTTMDGLGKKDALTSNGGWKFALLKFILHNGRYMKFAEPERLPGGIK